MPTSLASYPASSWRTHQRDYSDLVLAVAEMKTEARVGIEGPCGSGKSIGYLRALFAAEGNSVVLTTTRQHLHQLEETLAAHWPGGSWLVLRGRDHYGCCKAPRPAPNEDADPAEQWVAPPGSGCPLGLDCRYRGAVIKAGEAKVVLQCTIGALYRKRFWSELPEPDPTTGTAAQWEIYRARQSVMDRPVAVLDEAHEYLRVRRDFETRKLAVWPAVWPRELQDELKRARTKSGGYISSAVVLPSNSRLALAIEGEFRRQLRPEVIIKTIDALELAAKKSGRPFNRTAVELAHVKQYNDRIEMLTETNEDDAKYNPVVSLQWDGLKVALISEPLFCNVKEKFAPREVFTSATLRDVASLLAIDTKEWLHCFPAIFAAEAIDPAPMPDNAGGSKTNVALDADDLLELYSTEGRPLTIALFLSKKAAHAAVGRLPRGATDVFVQGLGRDSDADPEKSLGELVADVKQAATDGQAPLLVCYGGWVGTDIPGEKWLIVGQAPKTPLSVVAEERQRRGVGRGWNDYEKITLDRLQLAQGLGRALRTPEDRAVVIWPNNAAFRDLGMCPQTATLK